MSTKILPCAPEKWEKHGEIFKTSISDFICAFPSTVEYLGEGVWRVWICINEHGSNIGYAEGIPGEDMKLVFADRDPSAGQDRPLSIRNLPDGWLPTQPIHVKLDNGRHRLYFWAHGRNAKVVRLLVAESDDGRAYTVLDPYKACLYHPNDRASAGGEFAGNLGLTPSLEGIAVSCENEEAAPAELICNDATTIYKLDNGEWEMYSASLEKVSEDDPRYIAHDNARGLIRVIDRWESVDGLNWKNRKRVIQRDENDRIDQQFYHLAVAHTENGRVGLLGNYLCEDQTMDLEWCFSKDGIEWERPGVKAWLPRGEEGTDDCYAIYPTCDGITYAEGKYWLFYTGYNVSHNKKSFHGEKPCSSIMLASTEDIWS